MAVEQVTGTLLDSVNQGVAQVYSNQQRLERGAKALQVQTANFAKQTNQWLSMYKSLNAALKELGDVKNWAQVRAGGRQSWCGGCPHTCTDSHTCIHART